VQLVEPSSLPQLEGMHWLQPYRTALVHVLHLPGLLQLIVPATSAAMVTGLFHPSGNHYAAQQTGGAIATVTILLVGANAAGVMNGDQTSKALLVGLLPQLSTAK
jgi:hypothetical protein